MTQSRKYVTHIRECAGVQFDESISERGAHLRRSLRLISSQHFVTVLLKTSFSDYDGAQLIRNLSESELVNFRELLLSRFEEEAECEMFADIDIESKEKEIKDCEDAMMAELEEKRSAFKKSFQSRNK